MSYGTLEDEQMDVGEFYAEDDDPTSTQNFYENDDVRSLARLFGLRQHSCS
jgi:hypothetical protein